MSVSKVQLDRLHITPVMIGAVGTGACDVHFIKSYAQHGEPSIFQLAAVLTGVFTTLTIIVEFSPDGSDWESVGTFQPLLNGVGFFPCSEAGEYRLNITAFADGTSVDVYGQIAAPAGSSGGSGGGGVSHVIVDSGSVTVSGTVSSNLRDGAGNAITSDTRGSARPLAVEILDAAGNQITSFGSGTVQVSDGVNVVFSSTHPAYVQFGSAQAVTNTYLDYSLATIDSDIKSNITLHSGTNVIGKVSQDTSPWVVAGNLTNNNAAPSSNNVGVLPALATSIRPGYTHGNQALLSVDLSGHLRVRSREAGALGDTIITGEHINQIELNFSQAFDAGRITNTINTTGTAVQGSGCAKYSTGTGAAGSAKGVSVITYDYKPGHELYAYFTASFTAGAAASHQRIGFYNATDGFWIGYEGTVFGFTQYQNSVLVGGTANSAPSVARASFNGDPANASAGSQFTSGGTPVALDLTKINIWRIRGSWFGVAPISLDVFSPDGTWVTLHTFLFPNTLTTPYSWTTNWSMACEVVNAGNTTNLAIVTPCWGMGSTGSLEELSDTIHANDLAQLTKSVIFGHTTGGGGGFVEVKVNPSGALTADVSNSTGLAGTFIANQGTPVAGTSAWPTRPGSPTTTAWSQLPISFSASGASIIVPGVLGQTVRVMRLFFVNCSSTTSTNITIQDTTPTSFTGAVLLISAGTFNGIGDGEPLYTSASGKGIQINSSSAIQVSGCVWFTQS